MAGKAIRKVEEPDRRAKNCRFKDAPENSISEFVRERTSMPKDKPPNVFEPRQSIVCKRRCLIPLLPKDPYPHMRLLNHGNVIHSIPNRANPFFGIKFLYQFD